MVQAGTCTAPGGEKVPFRVGDETPAESYGLRIFAGARLDPFFVDSAGVRDTRELGRLSPARAHPDCAPPKADQQRIRRSVSSGI